MSFTDTDVKVSYQGNGSTTTFAIPFQVIVSAITETKVYVRDESGAEASETLKTYSTHYTISGSNVVFVTAPASTDVVVITRELPLTQTLDLVNNADFVPESQELALDRIVAMIQQVDEAVDRSLKFRISDSAALTADYLVAINSAGTGVELVAASSINNLSSTLGDPSFINFTEQSSAVATPSSGYSRIYVGTDHKAYLISSAGTETRLGPEDERASLISNLRIAATVSGNALTIAFKDNAGSDPSSRSPVKIAFRNATSATGNFIVRSLSAASSIVIPDTGTLGAQSAVLQYIYICALDNAGTIEPAVIGSRYDLDEGSIISSTTIGTGSDDWATMYSTTGRSNVAFRVLARLGHTQTTGGTYASAPSELSLYQGNRWPEGSSWKSDLTWAFAGLGTVAGNTNTWYKRDRDTMIIRGHVTAGTPAASTASITLPTGYTMDTSKLPTSTNAVRLGTAIQLDATGGAAEVYSTNIGLALFYDGSDNDSVFITSSQGGTAVQFTKENGSGFCNTGSILSYNFEIPIARWRSY